MRIAQIAPPWEPVPPPGYGGTERVVSFLTERLVKMGHDVTLFASGDSKTSARLVPTVSKALRNDGVRDGAPHILSALQAAYARAAEFDIFHSHVDYFALSFAQGAPIPTAHTLHGRLDLPCIKEIYSRFPEQPLVSISNSQRAPLGPQNWLATVYHGLPIDLYRFQPTPQNYLVFIGRMSPEKRPDWAIEIAERSETPLVMAAKVDPTDEKFFHEVVEPKLRKSKRTRFIGEVCDREKNELIGNARALLMPVDWPEPFGLTAIEALACGTPVLTRPLGALPEIITSGVNGFVESDIGELARTVQRLTEIDRAACRKTFEERFSDQVMAEGYVAAYEQILGQGFRRRGDWFILDSALASSIPKHVYKDNQAFLVVDASGDMTEELKGEFGFYRSGTRYLNKLELRVNGKTPLLLGSATRPEYEMIVVDLGNDEGAAPRNTIHIRRELTIEDDVFYQRLALSNFSDVSVAVDVEIELGADFADTFEVRGVRRASRGKHLGFFPDASGGEFRYVGLDGVERRTHVRAEIPPSRARNGRLAWSAALSAGSRFELALAVRGFAEAVPPAFEAPPAAEKKNVQWIEQTPVIESNDDRFSVAATQAIADLGQLMSWGVKGLYPCAGIPWYGTLFGRDSIIAALQLLPWRPDVAISTWRTLAHFQADAYDDFTDREPGKILHEWREGEMANLREIPFIPYFGTADATPLFIHLAHEIYAMTGDDGLLEEMWPHLVRASDWLQSHPSLITYKHRSPLGLRNHGWKDSADSVFHANGHLAEPPIALIEVQAYAFRAWKDLGRLARIRGDAVWGERCDARAQQLRERVDREFWMEDESTYGMALDADLRLCRTVSSNAAHCLFAGLPTLDRAARLAQRLRQPDLSSGHGVRTLSTRERRYNPMSYHNGTIWPHDNAIVCEGLRRYGLLQAMSEIHQEVLSALYTFPLRRVPELYCGFDRLLVREPIPYPTACAPQAWSSGALLMMLTQMMGLSVDGKNRRLVFTQIRLPEPIEWIRVHRLRVGGAEIHFTVDRGGSVEVDHRSAPIDVTIHK